MRPLSGPRLTCRDRGPREALQLQTRRPARILAALGGRALVQRRARVRAPADSRDFVSRAPSSGAQRIGGEPTDDVRPHGVHPGLARERGDDLLHGPPIREHLQFEAAHCLAAPALRHPVA